jgi:hypothetical protein
LLELVWAGDRQCSPLLRAQLERGQNGSFILAKKALSAAK